MIKDILLLQKREFEQKLSEPYVERDHPRSLFNDNDLIKVVIGPRRAGKSFFALHILSKMKSCGYVNLDDERLTGITDFDDILNPLDDIYGGPKHLLLDEIQNLPNWELLANRLQRQDRRLLITGSNSNLLSSELATHLTGRHQTILLFPFSFNEVLRLGGKELTVSERKTRLERYAHEGGFPEPLVKNVDRNEYLKTLGNAVLYKDIVKRFGIRIPHGLEDLTHYCFSNIAKEFSYQNLAKVTRCRSFHTVEKYLGYMEDAFLFFTVRRFSFKVREQAISNKKIYCVDNGMATALGFRFTPDEGRLLENLVAVVLHKKELNHEAEIFFWRNSQNEEVDFVVKENLRVRQLIQVCGDLSEPKTLNREVRALLKAGAELKCKDLLILNPDKEKTEIVEWFGLKGEIKYCPIWKWLCENWKRK